MRAQAPSRSPTPGSRWISVCISTGSPAGRRTVPRSGSCPGIRRRNLRTETSPPQILPAEVIQSPTLLAKEEGTQCFLPRARRKPRFPAWPGTTLCGTASSRICASASAKCAQTRRRACGCAASLILPVSKASRTRHLPRRRTALPWAMTRRFLRAAIPFWLLVSSSAAPSRVRT